LWWLGVEEAEEEPTPPGAMSQVMEATVDMPPARTVMVATAMMVIVVARADLVDLLARGEPEEPDTPAAELLEGPYLAGLADAPISTRAEAAVAQATMAAEAAETETMPQVEEEGETVALSRVVLPVQHLGSPTQMAIRPEMGTWR
jgi:hypothetical protein